MGVGMRRSKVLEKLRAGEAVNCMKSNLSSPRIADLIGSFGFDCLWLCLEHTSEDWSQLEAMIMAAKYHDMDTVVRVPKGCYSDFIRPLELDASGIMIPHLMSAKEAREIARTTRFRPTGLRPADGGNADGLYCRIPFTEYIEQANRERFIIVQIEDPEPLDELDEICSVEGIDIIFFGPGDFSHAIGVPGQIQHPEVEKARVRIAETARAHGKIAGTVGSVEGMARLVEMGYRFVNVGSDVQGLGAYYSRLTEGLGISASSGAAGYYGSGK